MSIIIFQQMHIFFDYGTSNRSLGLLVTSRHRINDTENKDESQTFIGSSQFDVQQYHASYEKNNGNH